MATIPLPPDFKEFLKLLNANKVDYLVIGGYAVNYHGYSRATVDIDVWVAVNLENSERLARAVRQFGFPSADASTFLEPERIVRMGVAPLRIEILNSISGVDFEECYPRGIDSTIDGVPIRLMNLEDLIRNKTAAGRLKDLTDIEHLS